MQVADVDKKAPYLRKHKNKDLRQCLTKIRLSSSSLREADGWNLKLITATGCVLCVKEETLKTSII